MLKRYPTFCLISIGAIFAFLVAKPATRRILVTQLSMFISPPRSFTGMLESLGIKEASILPGEARAARRALTLTAAKHPEDGEIQVAYAVMGNIGTPEPFYDRLQPLLARFPDDPFVQAMFMRYACMGQIAVRRPEESWLTADTPSPSILAGNNMLPNRLAEYLKAADAGEKRDPDNAFFPWLKCVGLFGARRDKEALEALHRAAGKKRFHEYLDTEALAHWRLAEEAYGEATAINRMATQMSMLFPHYAQMRGVARTATYLAAEKEKAGNREEGLRIRMDLMNLSARMRLESTTAIGTLVGVALEKVAMSRPGGAPPIKRDPRNEENEAAGEARRKKFIAYLESTGHAAEAKWTREELAAAEEAKRLVKEGTGIHLFGGAQLVPLIQCWTVGMVALTNAVWLAVLWALGFVLFNASKGRTGGLSAAEGGMLVGVCGGCLILLMGLLTWQEARSIDSFNQYKVVLENISFNGPTAPTPQAQTAAAGFIAAAIALPSVIFFGAVFGSLFKREEMLESFFGKLQKSAPLVLQVAGFGYLFIALQTARMENHAFESLNKAVRHEGRRMAELMGKPWPAAVPLRTAHP